MTEIQKTLFTLLTEVDDICRKYGITYFLHENSALEAVQKGHMGEERMIAEVIMRVPELLKFMDAFEQEKPAHRSLESWLSEARYGDFGCRYVNDDTLFLDLPNYHHYRKYGFAVRINVLRDFPASRIRSKLATAKEIGFEMTFAEGNRAEAKKYELCEKLVRPKLKTPESSLEFTRKMFGEFCGIYDNPNAERCFFKYFRTQRHHCERRWFAEPTVTTLEGRSFPVPAKEYFVSLYGQGYMSRRLPGRKMTEYIVADTEIPWRDYLKEIADAGLPLKKYISERERYIRKQKAGQPKVDTIKHYWDLLFRTGDRFELYEQYAPMKKELLAMRREGRYDELSAALAPYREKLMKNYKLGLGLCFDPEIFDCMLDVLRREGNAPLAAELREMIPQEHLQPIVIKGYDDD